MDTHEQQQTDSVDSHESRFRELVALLLRTKWFIIGTTAAITLLVAIFTLQRPPTCEGKTTVLINMKAGQQANPFAQTIEGGTNKMANEMAILKARGLARTVAEKLLMNPFLDSAQALILPVVRRDPDAKSSQTHADPDVITDRLQKAVSFLPERESDIIRIIATSSEPVEAALLANTFADSYQEQIMQQSRSRSRSVREFLEGRLAEQRSQLAQADGDMKSFMETSGVVSLDGESNRLVKELSQLEATRNSLSIEIEGLDKKMASLRSELPQQESSAANMIGQANDPYIRLLSEQLARLEVQRDVTLAQNDPAVLNQGVNQAKLKELGDQIDALRENLRARTTELINDPSGIGSAGNQADPLNYIRGLRQQLLETKFQLETLQSRRSALNRIIAGYEAQFRLIPRHSLNFARVQRERLSTEKLYGLVEEKYNEAAITEKSEFGYVDIIDRATPEASRGRSQLFLNTLLGLLAGLGLSIGAVVIKDGIDVRVRTPQQLRRKGFTALSEVPPLDKELATLDMQAFIPEGARNFSPQFRLISHPLSFTAESYRRLRTRLMRIQIEQPLKTILISSPNPGEGKTTTLLNLALCLAETDQRVLVIDCDLRRPAVHTQFQLPVSPGLSEMLSKSASFEECMHRDVVPNLDVLTCGSRVDHPSRFFGQKQSTYSLTAVKKNYAWILLDAPPILVVNDAAMLSSMADGTVLIADAGSTRLEALERATEFLQRAGGKLLGVVLNHFDPKDAYGAYYGSDKYGHYDTRHKYYHTTPEEWGSGPGTSSPAES